MELPSTIALSRLVSQTRAMRDAVGQALRHAVQPGQPIMLADLGRPMVVQKGMPMTLALDSPGIQLTAQGVAMEPAGVG